MKKKFLSKIILIVFLVIVNSLFVNEYINNGILVNGVKTYKDKSNYPFKKLYTIVYNFEYFSTNAYVNANEKGKFENENNKNGMFDGKLYKNGLESNGRTYIKGIFYDENKSPANGWYDDGFVWSFFKDGKKFSGKYHDGNDEIYFIDGNSASNYIQVIFYKKNKISNGWHDDGKEKSYYLNGIKYTGFYNDGNGYRNFVNGKYANGRFNGRLYTEGLETQGNIYINGIYFDSNKYPANGWNDDGSDSFFFKNGEKFTGYEKDENVLKYFVNGKYANGLHEGKYYLDGGIVDLVDSDWFVLNGIWKSRNTGRTCNVNGDFIVISLRDQKLWLVRGGNIISKIGIVSGKHVSPTIRGNFRVVSKETSRILKGEDYASWVRYWMQFHGNYGIHDANWQPSSAFSNSSYYRWGGSHGCVNVHPSKMGYIYSNSYVGMRVIVY